MALQLDLDYAAELAPHDAMAGQVRSIQAAAMLRTGKSALRSATRQNPLAFLSANPPLLCGWRLGFFFVRREVLNLRCFTQTLGFLRKQTGEALV